MSDRSGTKMCARFGCDLLAQRTRDRTCPGCGCRTEAWDSDWARRLLRFTPAAVTRRARGRPVTVCTTPGCELVGIPADGPYCDRCGSLLELLETPQPHDGSEVAPSPVLVVTTNDVPGYRITKVHGDVFGLIVRAGNYFSNLGARMHTLVGGEVAGYTSLLIDSRNEARARLMDSARSAGANAVVAFRFDCNEIGGVMSEIAAYGTAVTVVPLDEVSSAGAVSLGEG